MGGKSEGMGDIARSAEEMGMAFLRQGKAPRKLIFQQLREALGTGNVEARIPIIQAQVEDALGRGSQALREGEESIFQAGAGRTPVAQETLAAGRAQVQSAIGSIPSEVIGQTVLNAPNTISAANQAIMQLMGVAQQGEALRQAAKAQNYASTMSQIGGGVGGLIGIVRSASGGGGMGG